MVLRQGAHIHALLSGGRLRSERKLPFLLLTTRLTSNAFEKPITHRDLKSANILLNAKKIGKVADCGESRKVSSDSTMTQVGTPLYASPEILRGDRYDESVDTYSFGVIISEVKSRETPFADVPWVSYTDFSPPLP